MSLSSSSSLHDPSSSYSSAKYDFVLKHDQKLPFKFGEIEGRPKGADIEKITNHKQIDQNGWRIRVGHVLVTINGIVVLTMHYEQIEMMLQDLRKDQHVHKQDIILGMVDYEMAKEEKRRERESKTKKPRRRRSRRKSRRQSSVEGEEKAEQVTSYEFALAHRRMLPFSLETVPGRGRGVCVKSLSVKESPDEQIQVGHIMLAINGTVCLTMSEHQVRTVLEHLQETQRRDRQDIIIKMIDYDALKRESLGHMKRALEEGLTLADYKSRLDTTNQHHGEEQEPSVYTCFVKNEWSQLPFVFMAQPSKPEGVVVEWVRNQKKAGPHVAPGNILVSIDETNVLKLPHDEVDFLIHKLRKLQSTSGKPIVFKFANHLAARKHKEEKAEAQLRAEVDAAVQANQDEEDERNRQMAEEEERAAEEEQRAAEENRQNALREAEAVAREEADRERKQREWGEREKEKAKKKKEERAARKAAKQLRAMQEQRRAESEAQAKREEAQRQAEAAALAEKLKVHLIEFEVHGGAKDLPFTLQDLSENQYHRLAGACVKSVVDRSKVGSRLKKGDVLLSVNGVRQTKIPFLKIEKFLNTLPCTEPGSIKFQFIDHEEQIFHRQFRAKQQEEERARKEKEANEKEAQRLREAEARRAHPRRTLVVDEEELSPEEVAFNKKRQNEAKKRKEIAQQYIAKQNKLKQIARENEVNAEGNHAMFLGVKTASADDTVSKKSNGLKEAQNKEAATQKVLTNRLMQPKRPLPTNKVKSPKKVHVKEQYWEPAYYNTLRTHGTAGRDIFRPRHLTLVQTRREQDALRAYQEREARTKRVEVAYEKRLKDEAKLRKEEKKHEKLLKNRRATIQDTSKVERPRKAQRKAARGTETSSQALLLSEYEMPENLFSMTFGAGDLGVEFGYHDNTTHTKELNLIVTHIDKSLGTNYLKIGDMLHKINSKTVDHGVSVSAVANIIKTEHRPIKLVFRGGNDDTAADAMNQLLEKTHSRLQVRKPENTQYRNTIRQRIDMLYAKYNVDGDGHLTRDELATLVKQMRIFKPDEPLPEKSECLKLIRMMGDLDRRGTVKKTKFSKWVLNYLEMSPEEHLLARNENEFMLKVDNLIQALNMWLHDVPPPLSKKEAEKKDEKARKILNKWEAIQREFATLLGLDCALYEGIWTLYDNDGERWVRTSPAHVQALHTLHPLAVTSCQVVEGVSGGIPLHYATSHARLETATAVYHLHPDGVQEPNGDGETPMDVALRLKRLHLICLFLGFDPAKTNVNLLFENTYDANAKRWLIDDKHRLLQTLKIDAEDYRHKTRKAELDRLKAERHERQKRHQERKEEYEKRRHARSKHEEQRERVRVQLEAIQEQERIAEWREQKQRREKQRERMQRISEIHCREVRKKEKKVSFFERAASFFEHKKQQVAASSLGVRRDAKGMTDDLASATWPPTSQHEKDLLLFRMDHGECWRLPAPRNVLKLEGTTSATKQNVIQSPTSIRDVHALGNKTTSPPIKSEQLSDAKITDRKSLDTALRQLGGNNEAVYARVWAKADRETLKRAAKTNERVKVVIRF